MDIRTTILNGLVESHINLVEARADYAAAVSELIKLTETKTHIEDRVSLPLVFTDAEDRVWIIHHNGDRTGLTVRPAAAVYREAHDEG